LSNASVQVVGVFGSISLRRAWEHDSGADMVEKVVKEVGRFRVWWRRVPEDWGFVSQGGLNVEKRM
jgi:hypothetical protein